VHISGPKLGVSAEKAAKDAKDVTRIAESPAPKIEAAIAAQGIPIRKEEVPEVAVAAWVALRTGERRTQLDLTSELLAAKVKDLARVPIKSIPDKATVTIDGLELPDTTDNQFWMGSGPHKLVVSKGKLSKEKDIEVHAGQNDVIEITLDAAP
jgi:hypothetical protein